MDVGTIPVVRVLVAVAVAAVVVMSVMVFLSTSPRSHDRLQ